MSDIYKLSLIGLAALLGAGGAAVAALFTPHPLSSFVFFVFAGMLVISALGAVLTRNIVRTSMWLLGALGSVAGLYFLLGAGFAGVVQLIVYAGGVLVLIVFGVMLTGRSPFMTFRPTPVEAGLAASAGLILFVSLCVILVASAWPALPRQVALRAATLEDVGRSLLTDYLVPFEVVSVLLLAVMIGAAYLARPVRRA